MMGIKSNDPIHYHILEELWQGSARNLKQICVWKSCCKVCQFDIIPKWQTYLQVAAAANLASLGVEAAVHLGDPLCLAPINKEKMNSLFSSKDGDQELYKSSTYYKFLLDEWQYHISLCNSPVLPDFCRYLRKFRKCVLISTICECLNIFSKNGGWLWKLEMKDT